MTWARFDDQADDHPKIAGLTDRAFRWWFRGCLYSNRYLLDGVLPLTFLSRVPGRALGELVDAGLWEPTGAAVLIHDFHDYNPTADAVKAKRQQTADRVKRFRKRVTGSDVTREVIRVGNDAPGPSRPVPVVLSESVLTSTPSVPDDASVLWESVKAYIQTEIQEKTFREWFTRVEHAVIRGQVLELVVRQMVVADYLTKHFSHVITEALAVQPGSSVKKFCAVVRPLSTRAS